MKYKNNSYIRKYYADCTWYEQFVPQLEARAWLCE